VERRDGWRWMFAAGAYCNIFARAIAFSKESPPLAYERGYEQQAQDVLVAINGVPAADAEGAEIRKSLAQEEGAYKNCQRTVSTCALDWISSRCFFTNERHYCLLSSCPKYSKAPGNALPTLFPGIICRVVNLVFTLLAVWLVD